MITNTKLFFYLLYLFFLAIWLGSGFHDTVSGNFTWFKDPITHINHSITHPVPGAINPWPISTGLVVLTTIICFILFMKYKGKGKSYAFISICGTLILLVATFGYFVPTLIKIFGETSSFNDQELISMSQQWVILNIIRILVLMVLFMTGLIGLTKFYRQ